MSIKRTRLSFESEFTQIPNAWLRDKRLSRKARGLLAELMSHTIGWYVTVDSLVAAGPEGRDGIRVAINELEKFGYLRKERTRDESGKMRGVSYELTVPQEDQPKLDFPTLDEPKSDLPTLVLPTLANPPLRIKESLEEQRAEKGTAATRRSKLSTLPENFSVTEAMTAWAKLNAPLVDIASQTEQFKDWHAAKGSTFRDWTRAWHTWMRKSQEYSGWRSQKVAVLPGSIWDTSVKS